MNDTAGQFPHDAQRSLLITRSDWQLLIKLAALLLHVNHVTRSASCGTRGYSEIPRIPSRMKPSFKGSRTHHVI